MSLGESLPDVLFFPSELHDQVLHGQGQVQGRDGQGLSRATFVVLTILVTCAEDAFSQRYIVQVTVLYSKSDNASAWKQIATAAAFSDSRQMAPRRPRPSCVMATVAAQRRMLLLANVCRFVDSDIARHVLRAVDRSA